MDEERARRDRRLAERIDAGDANALEEIYDTYSGAVYRQAMAVLGSAADAEDVVQDVFLKLVRRRGGPIWDLQAYLLTAARHQSCSSLRQRSGTDSLDDAETVFGMAARPRNPSMEGQEVREALQALPAEQREVVVLKIYEQLTFEEIGRALRASANTVASRYRYALKKLRRSLGDSTDAS